MSLSVEVQVALEKDSVVTVPDMELIEQWAGLAISHARGNENKDSQMTVRIVNEEEIERLNSDYRHKNKTTNVLSFPFVRPPGIPENETPGLLGDLVVCAAVVNREAEEQHKTVAAHWAHMVVHGTLHLLGCDHVDEQQAHEMEALETEILSELGFDNPYQQSF